jgi:hypothetical protein
MSARVDGGGGEVLAVERVQVCVSGLVGSHEPLIGETPQGSVHCRLRADRDESGDLATRQSTRSAAENTHDFHVERRPNRSPGV